MISHAFDAEALLSPAEVAALFRVHPKTVTQWAKAGKLKALRTLGGHRRYREAEVRNLLGRTDSPPDVGRRASTPGAQHMSGCVALAAAPPGPETQNLTTWAAHVHQR